MTDRNKTYVDLIGFGEYAFVQQPCTNKFTKSQEYCVNIQITDSGMAALLDAGLSEQVFNPTSNTMQSRFRVHKDKGYRFLTLKKKVHMKDGEIVTYAPKVTDSTGALTDAIPGNGSLLKVTAVVEDILKDGKPSGRKVTLGNVQILDLVEYEKKGDPGLTQEEIEAGVAEATAALGKMLGA